MPIDAKISPSRKTCRLADGSIHQVHETTLHVCSPYFTGYTPALIFQNACFPFLLGNIKGALFPTEETSNRVIPVNHQIGVPKSSKPPSVVSLPSYRSTDDVTNNGSRDPSKVASCMTSLDAPSPDTVHIGVITRGSIAKQKHVTPSPLHAPVIDDLDLSPSQLSEMQKNDPILNTFFHLAKSGEVQKDKANASISYFVNNDILFRRYQAANDPHGYRCIKQVMVPEVLKNRIMQVAHVSNFSGHMNASKTVEIIRQSFFWKDMLGSVTRFVQSCDTCQRCAPKPVKAPMGTHPVISQPFYQVCVDLIGEISTPSSQGHKYILLSVDYATRYCQAVALKKTNTQTIVDALLEFWCSTGIPSVMRADNAPNLSGNLMKEVARVLSIKLTNSIALHPMSNGLVESYVKSVTKVLRKLTVDRPSDWHRYLSPTLFCLRQMPNSTGFSSFELIYGKKPRSPVQILKEVWTKQVDDEVASPYKYVADLKRRIKETADLARVESQKVQKRNKVNFDKHAKMRHLNVGDNVLLLRPDKTNKLDVKWFGPFKVLERDGRCTYVVDVRGKKRLYHINMMKKYNENSATVNSIAEDSQRADMTSHVGHPVPTMADMSHSIHNQTNIVCGQLNTSHDVMTTASPCDRDQGNNHRDTTPEDIDFQSQRSKGVSDDNPLIDQPRSGQSDQHDQSIESTADHLSTGVPILNMANAVIVDETPGDDGIESVEIHPPRLSGGETYKDVIINPDLSEGQQQEIRNILCDFQDVLSEIPGKTHLEEHTIELTSDEPLRRRPYPTPQALQQTMKEEISEMLKHGIIEESNSDFCNPCLMVKKADGKFRFVFDARLVNSHTKFDCESVQNMETMFDDFHDSKYFAVIDLSKSYWQVPLAESSKKYTAFSTGLDQHLYQFTRTPFGLLNSGKSFCRLMRKVLRGIKHVKNYIDDIIIHARNWQELITGLKAVLQRLREAGLTARPSKIKIGFPEIPFLGHIVGHGFKKPQLNKIETILNTKPPPTKKTMQSFLGLTNFYAAYIPNYALYAAPLSEVIKKNHPEKIKWHPGLDEPFNHLKKVMASSPVLKLVDFSLEMYLRTDASMVGIAGVLFQKHDGVSFPVVYIGRKLLDREKRYSVIELECLSLVYCISKLKYYLIEREFVLETDAKSLLYLNKNKNSTNSRLTRWSLQLQEYRFRVKAIKGASNHGADFLSRTVQ